MVLGVVLVVILMGVRQVQACLAPQWRPVRSVAGAVERVRELQSLAPAGEVGWRGGEICGTHPADVGFVGYVVSVMDRDEGGRLHSCRWVYVEPTSGHAKRIGCYMGDSETPRGCKPLD